jgi:hypothetical protein
VGIGSDKNSNLRNVRNHADTSHRHNQPEVNNDQEVKVVSDPPHQVEQEPQTQPLPTSKAEPRDQITFFNKEMAATMMPARMETFTGAKSQVDTTAPLAMVTKIAAALTKALRRMGVVLDGWMGRDSEFCVCID